MTAIKTKKTFDCIAFKRKAQTQIYKEIRGMSPQSQIAYFTRKAGAGRLGKWWKKVRKASGT